MRPMSSAGGFAAPLRYATALPAWPGTVPALPSRWPGALWSPPRDGLTVRVTGLPGWRPGRAGLAQLLSAGLWSPPAQGRPCPRPALQGPLRSLGPPWPAAHRSARGPRRETGAYFAGMRTASLRRPEAPCSCAHPVLTRSQDHPLLTRRPCLYSEDAKGAICRSGGGLKGGSVRWGPLSPGSPRAGSWDGPAALGGSEPCRCQAWSLAAQLRLARPSGGSAPGRLASLGLPPARTPPAFQPAPPPAQSPTSHGQEVSGSAALSSSSGS